MAVEVKLPKKADGFALENRKDDDDNLVSRKAVFTKRSPKLEARFNHK